MKNSRIIRAICLSLLLATSSSAQAKMIDPFFGIDYDPSQIHFEQMPVAVKAQCAEIRDRYTKAWVYAHLKTTSTDYYILYGYLKVLSESHPGQFTAELEDGDGIIVAITGDKCLVDQWQYLFRKAINPAKNATPIQVSDQVLKVLATAVLKTYEKAFGGKKQFLKLVTQEARTELPPVLLEQLVAYEKMDK
ncbi:MAG TPA: hypothetical protein VKT53_06035 [Candidatus Acidoferrum sp.]|nr:hypothetical protein [Candidatus Acidoferrum sp.]